jgi:threonyl-tRNA synthetase
VVKETDWPPLNSRANKIFKEKQPFERLDVSKENLKKMFGYSKYKMHYINNLIEGESSTVYRCGTLVDLCRGPHIQNTNKIKAFEINKVGLDYLFLAVVDVCEDPQTLTDLSPTALNSFYANSFPSKNSSAYFLGDQNGDSLQRIYGVAFPDKKSLAEHKKYLEEAAKRDHRKLGTEQELFMFDGEVAPGCAFLLPNGTIIFNAIQKMLRSEYQMRGYQEVQSPNMYDSSLWVQSGHWEHYQEDMFRLEIEKRVWGLKPMNCPGHCKIFGHRERSWRELPLRMADFGVLHRNEASGALNGLMRVRKFQQDDTHIFCTQDQVPYPPFTTHLTLLTTIGDLRNRRPLRLPHSRLRPLWLRLQT